MATVAMAVEPVVVAKPLQKEEPRPPVKKPLTAGHSESMCVRAKIR